MASHFPYSPADERVFLSTMPAGPRQRRVALIVVLVALSLCLVGLPFARTPLPEIWGFVPVSESWLILLDLITAVLLFGQFAILRSRGLLIIGSAYLFTSTITALHLLSFPGVFAQAGLLGGTQATAWFYGFWKVGFLCFLVAYALLKDKKPEPRWPFRRAVSPSWQRLRSYCWQPAQSW